MRAASLLGARGAKRRRGGPLLLAGLLTGCTAVGRLPQLEPGYYTVIETNDSALRPRLAGRRRLYVEQAGDTLHFTPDSAARVASPASFDYGLQPGRHVTLLARRFDLDVFTIPFKVRPPQAPLPVQLNPNFNAALYFGRRLDGYHLTRRRVAPGRFAPLIRTTGLGYGAFVGLGSTLVNADNTRQQTRVAEYDGLVVHAGVATIYDARVFNLGLAVGADQLLGPDGRHWVYQRRPWVGLLFGLDLN